MAQSNASLDLEVKNSFWFVSTENIFLFKLGVIVCCGGIVYGYSVGIISGAVLQLTKVFGIDDVQEGLIVSLLSLGALLGCVLGGYLSDKIGRWKTIQVQNFIYILGSIILTSAVNLNGIYVGRFVVGMGTSFAATADVPYLQEVAPSEHRGRLTTMFEISVVLGALLGSLSSLSFEFISQGWRIMFALPCGVSIIQAVLLFLLPESPKWLVEHHREDDSKAALLTISCGDEVKAASRLEEFKSECTHSLNAGHSQALFYQYRLPLGLVLVFMILGQLTGSVVLRNYAPTIFEEAGFGQTTSLLFNVIASILNFFIVVSAGLMVDRVGRLTLLYVGFLVAAVGFSLLACGFLVTGKNIPLFFFGTLFALAGFNLGFGPVGWLVSSEMFPTYIRGRALAASTMMRNLFEFLTNLIFLASTDGIHNYGTFFVFVSFSFVSILFVRVFLVETSGIPPEEILRQLEEKFPCCISMSRVSGHQHGQQAELDDKNVAVGFIGEDAESFSPIQGIAMTSGVGNRNSVEGVDI